MKNFRPLLGTSQRVATGEIISNHSTLVSPMGGPELGAGETLAT